MNERLYRSVDDRVIAGVCGGLAVRLAVDPSLVRILWAVVALITGIFPLLVIYVIMAAVVPEDPRGFAGVGPSPAPWPSPTPPDEATMAGASVPTAPASAWYQGSTEPRQRSRAHRDHGPLPAAIGGLVLWRSGSTSWSATGSRSTGASSGRPALSLLGPSSSSLPCARAADGRRARRVRRARIARLGAPCPAAKVRPPATARLRPVDDSGRLVTALAALGLVAGLALALPGERG